MRTSVPSVNVLVSVLYILVSALALYSLKKANKPHKKYNNKQKELQEPENKINFNLIFAKSWVKKYTLIGSFFCENKDYLVK